MEFSVGNALRASARIWTRNVVPFTLLSTLLHLPVLVLVATGLRGAWTDDDLTVPVVIMVASTLVQIARPCLVGLVTGTVVGELSGSPVSIGRSVQLGLGRLLPTLAVALAVYYLVTAGLCVLVVPGLILWSSLSVAIPATIVERPGFTGAFKRSAALTAGRRLPIFGMRAVVFGLGILLPMLLGFGLTSQAPAADPYAATAQLRVVAYAVLGTDILVGGFAAVLTAVTYAQLRFGKDTKDLTAAFD